MSPRIMKVAVRSSQHSPMLGQWASSQTECRFHCRMRPLRRTKLGPPGARTLSQDGLGESVGRGASRRGRETPITVVLSPSTASLWHILHKPPTAGAHGSWPNVLRLGLPLSVGTRRARHVTGTTAHTDRRPARASPPGADRGRITTEGVVPKGGLEPPRVAPHAPQT